MPTLKELRDYIPPQDVIDKLNEIEKTFGVPYKDLKNRFNKILCHPAYDMFGNVDERCRAACTCLLEQFKSKLLNGSKCIMEFKVFDMTSITQFEKETEMEEIDPTTNTTIKLNKIVTTLTATVYGIISSNASNFDEPLFVSSKPMLGILKLYNEACQLLQYLEKGKSYKLKCKVKPFNDHYELTMNKFEEPELINTNLPSIQDILPKLFEPIPVSQAQYNLGDFKLIHGKISGSKTLINKKGKMQGNITVENIGPKKFGEKSYLNVVWWNAPEFATRYVAGSEVYILTKLVDNGNEYGVGGIGHFIIPLVVPCIDKGLKSESWD